MKHGPHHVCWTCCRLALDVVTLETYTEGLQLSSDRPPWMHDPLNPFMIAANIVWLIFFGAPAVGA